MIGELYPGEFDAMEHNGRMDALEQEPCSDLISKEDTLKAMSNTWSHICYVARRKKPTKGEEAVYSDMVGTVKNLPPATAEPCEDAISRSDMLDAIGHGKTYTSEELQKIIKALPPVNPQPKTGHWIEIAKYSDGKHEIECSECGSHIFDRGHANSYVVKEKYKYCPRCGFRMIEPQESEDKCKNCEYYHNPDYTRCHKCKAESEE